jgi:hypothetical protein
VDLGANAAGVMFPRAEWGRFRLSSSFHEVMALPASTSVENSVSLNREGRIVRLRE